MVSDILNLVISLFQPSNFAQGNILIFFPLGCAVLCGLIKVFSDLMHVR